MSESSSLTGIFEYLELPRWRTWREIAIVSMMVMEISWVTPWYRALTPGTSANSPARVFAVLIGIAFFAHLVARMMNFLRLKIQIRRLILGGLLILAAYVGVRTLFYYNEPMNLWDLLTRPIRALSDLTMLIPEEVVVVLAVLFVSWRGIHYAQSYIGPRLVLRNFQIGIFMFIWFILINTLVTAEEPGLMLHLFLFAALLAMGTARVSVLSGLRGGRRSPFERRWFIGLLVAVIGAVGLATGVAALVTGDAATIVNLVIGFVIGFIFILSLPFMYLLLLVLYWVIDQIQFEDSRLGEAIRDIITQLQGLIQTLSDFLSQHFGFLRFLGDYWESWAPAVKTVVCAGALLLVATVILIAVKVRSRRYLPEEMEDRETLIEGGDLWRLLQAALRDRFRDLAELFALQNRLGHRQRALAAARVRQIYAHLMELSARLDHPRPPVYTPLEFQPTLISLFPTLEDELWEVTRAYLRVRYGEIPESKSEVLAVEDAWRKISAAGRQMLNAGKRRKGEAAAD